MNFPGSLGRFSNDQRAVSAVVGFILVFGILILLLTVYQAQIVPQQNAQTEFEHFEDNKNEMIELRNAISDAGQNDFSRFASVNLGPNYETRLLTINPAPPAGTLQTHDAPPIKIWNTSEANPEPKTVSTKFIEYQPGYNELRTGPIWYEHSTLYLDERDHGNGVSIIEDQNLVVDSGNSLTVTAVQNDFQRAGTERVTLELYTNTSAVGSLPDDYRILIPTRLDETYWNNTNIPEEAWADENSAVDPDPDLESYDEFDEPIFGLNLTNDSSESPDLNLDLNTVGIQSVPDVEEDELRNMPVQSGESVNGGGSPSPPTENNPEFNDINAEVTATQGASSQIDEFDVTGTVSSSTGETITISWDNGADSVDMSSSFSFNSLDGGSSSEIEEIIISLQDDSGEIYQECVSEEDLEDGSPLNINDFNCD